MLLFDEIDQTNRAYCKALGLDASQYETPLSPAEVEVADYMQRHGVSHRAASMLIAVNDIPPRQVAMGPRKPPGRCIVEYATRRSIWDQQRIEPSEYTHGNWTGD